MVLERLWIAECKILSASRRDMVFSTDGCFYGSRTPSMNHSPWLSCAHVLFHSSYGIEGDPLAVPSFWCYCFYGLTKAAGSLSIFRLPLRRALAERDGKDKIWTCLWLRCRVKFIMAVSTRYSSGRREKGIRSVAPLAVFIQIYEHRFLLCPLSLIPFFSFLPDLHGRRGSDSESGSSIQSV